MPEKYRIFNSTLQDIKMEIQKYGIQDENQEITIFAEEARKLFPDISDEDYREIYFSP